MCDFEEIRKYVWLFTMGVYEKTDFEGYKKEDIDPKNNVAEIYFIMDRSDQCFISYNVSGDDSKIHVFYQMLS